MIGAKLGNYRILEKIGAGGQGTVYKATDTKLGRAVVIKVLPPELTVKEANLKRFEREARLASSLLILPQGAHCDSVCLIKESSLFRALTLGCSSRSRPLLCSVLPACDFL